MDSVKTREVPVPVLNVVAAGLFLLAIVETGLTIYKVSLYLSNMNEMKSLKTLLAQVREREGSLKLKVEEEHSKRSVPEYVHTYSSPRPVARVRQILDGIDDVDVASAEYLYGIKQDRITVKLTDTPRAIALIHDADLLHKNLGQSVKLTEVHMTRLSTQPGQAGEGTDPTGYVSAPAPVTKIGPSNWEIVLEVTGK